MFGWFKKKPYRRSEAEQKEAFQRHALKAEGSPFVRSMIAEAMCSIEEEAVTMERDKRPVAERWKFMVTYECFVTYALRIGVERVLGPGSFQEAHEAIRVHLIIHADFLPDHWPGTSGTLDASRVQRMLRTGIWGDLDAFVLDKGPIGNKSLFWYDTKASWKESGQTDIPSAPIERLSIASMLNKDLFPNGVSSDNEFHTHVFLELRAIANIAEKIVAGMRQQNML